MSIAELYQNYFQKSGHVTIDTRKVLPGCLFFGVGRKNQEGVRRGCEFAEAAAAAGAAVLVINDPQLKKQHAAESNWILVEDTELALQELATYHRQQLNIPVIAIAGSNGKTTTKQLMEAVLATSFKVFSTPGNLNNHLGVPLSILQIQTDHQMAILELGANHVGETALLANIAQPSHGLLTNHGKDHLGEYGSVEKVIAANEELYDYFTASHIEGVWVNASDEALIKSAQKLISPIYYGLPSNRVHVEILEEPKLKLKVMMGEEQFEVNIALFGGFWSAAVLAAVQAAAVFNVAPRQVKEALEAYRPQDLRSEFKSWKGHQLLLDCYNANPSSMELFIDAAQKAKTKQPKILLLGEMLELGDYSLEEHHKLVYEWIEYFNFEEVILFGSAFDPLELPRAALHFKDIDLLKELLFNLLDSTPRSIYVKGSRGNQLEKIFS